MDQMSDGLEVILPSRRSVTVEVPQPVVNDPGAYSVEKTPARGGLVLVIVRNLLRPGIAWQGAGVSSKKFKFDDQSDAPAHPDDVFLILYEAARS